MVSILFVTKIMMQLFAVSLCVLIYHTSTANGACKICSYKTDEAQCTDTYVPTGTESTVCLGAIDGALCKKYGGGYSIYCRTGGSFTSCNKQQSPCPGSAGHAQSLYWVTVVSVFVAIAARFRFQ